jgi:hypothetical protein
MQSQTDQSDLKGAKAGNYALSAVASSAEGFGFLICNAEGEELAQVLCENEKEARKALAAMEVVLAHAIAFVPEPFVLIRRE